jgi:phage N-6-adenine-methyltransferase
MTDALALRDITRQQLAEIKTIETGIEYLSKMKAIETWARAEKKDAELQQMIAEQKIRTQRILGRLISEGQARGEIAKKSENQANLVRGNDKVQTLADIGITRNESSAFKAIASIPEDIFETEIQEKKNAVDRALNELTTSGMVALAKGRPHVANNSGENEWYTPLEYIAAAKRVMLGIDTDPASSEIANRTVRATKYFTADDDGLVQKWAGRVWMNPPYSQPLISQFCEAVTAKYQSGEITAAIVLVNNATETIFFQRMLEAAVAVCFVKGRIKFLTANGEPGNTPLQGQCVVYFGGNIPAFWREFSGFGKILTV